MYLNELFKTIKYHLKQNATIECIINTNKKVVHDLKKVVTIIVRSNLKNIIYSFS